MSEYMKRMAAARREPLRAFLANFDVGRLDPVPLAQQEAIYKLGRAATFVDLFCEADQLRANRSSKAIIEFLDRALEKYLLPDE